MQALNNGACAHLAELGSRVVRLHKDRGSCTVDVGAGGTELSGEAAYTISPMPDRSSVLDRPPAIADLVSFILRNDDLLSREPYVLRVARVGCSHHLDVSVVHPELNTAVLIAEIEGAQSVWDLEGGHHIWIRALNGRLLPEPVHGGIQPTGAMKRSTRLAAPTTTDLEMVGASGNS